jgi:hypothetical protein
MLARERYRKAQNVDKSQVMLVGIGVTNRGGCVSSRSSGSPLVLGNQKLRKEALLVGRKSRYLCTLEIKPIPSHPAFGRPLFVLPLPAGCGIGAL